MPYLLDANVFIEAKNRYYHFNVCPGFWDWLEKANKKGIVYSIDKVKTELISGNDELSEWAKEKNSDFFIDEITDELQNALGNIAEWTIKNQKYESSAKHTFLASTDYYLIAYAMALNYTVVTHEKYSNSRKKIKIPNVCLSFKIQTVTTFEMLMKEGVKFILQEPPTIR